MNNYLQLWGYCLIGTALGCFVLYVLTILPEQSSAPIWYGCVGALFSVAFYYFGYALYPVWRYIMGRIKGQPYSFKERLTGVRWGGYERRME